MSTSNARPAGGVGAWLPSLEMARSAKASVQTKVWWRRRGVDLLAREPSAARQLAAVLVHARRPGGETLLRYPYVPSMPFPLEEGTAQLFERYPDAEPPECLRVELERRSGGDPYRGIARSDPSFHGFDYGDALAQVRAQLASLRSSHPTGELEVATFAWPILRLSYRSLTLRRELALLVRPDGVLHAMLCKGTFL